MSKSEPPPSAARQAFEAFFEPAGPPLDPEKYPGICAATAARKAVRRGEPVPPSSPAGPIDILDEYARLFMEDNPKLTYEKAYELAKYC